MLSSVGGLRTIRGHLTASSYVHMDGRKLGIEGKGFPRARKGWQRQRREGWATSTYTQITRPCRLYRPLPLALRPQDRGALPSTSRRRDGPRRDGGVLELHMLCGSVLISPHQPPDHTAAQLLSYCSDIPDIVRWYGL
jgi:hypothetical protein